MIIIAMSCTYSIKTLQQHQAAQAQTWIFTHTFFFLINIKTYLQTPKEKSVQWNQNFMWEGRNIIPFLRSNQTPLKWLWNDRNYTARTNRIEKTLLLWIITEENYVHCLHTYNNPTFQSNASVVAMMTEYYHTHVLSTLCKQQRNLPFRVRFHCCHYRNMTSVFDVSIDCRATMPKFTLSINDDVLCFFYLHVKSFV